MGYATAEVLFDEWEPWNDLPIRLRFDNGGVVAVAWSAFDSLWLANDSSLPFDIYDSHIRWTENSLTELNPLLGGVILSVSLGQIIFTMENKNIPLDARLLINTDRGVLDIFNALDENGYAFLPSLPENTKGCMP
ncbi:hypothetical protein JHU04_001597 [Brenneria sp. 4F2]|nr:hypothetical protein [Brenneria bubanii]